MNYALIVFIFLGVGIVFQFLISRLISKYFLALSKTLKKFGIIIFLLIGLVIAHPYLQIEERIKIITEKSIEFLMIFSIFVSISYFTNQAIENYFKKLEFVPSISIFKNFISFIIIITGFLFALHNVGVKVTTLLTGFGIASLPIVLALQPTLVNIFSGFQVILSKQLKIGNYIKLSTGEEGYVIDINWRNTIIKKLDNNLIIIPNSKLADSIIINYSLPEKFFYISIPININYNGDLEKVEKITIEIAKNVLKNFGITDFEPYITIENFTNSSLSFDVILKVNEFSQQSKLKDKFLREIYKKFKEEGII
ncbi:MAG: mechanosensitive ion channel domain-containing protein [candidate division WOR-3 bacterium]